MCEARHGWVLQWFVKDEDDLVDECEIRDVTVEELQELFSEPSPDDMMCLSYPVGRQQAAGLGSKVVRSIDLARYDYFVSGWGERGFRTPAGLYPPPRDLSALGENLRPARPKTPK
jgi:hypothetical protein